MITTICYSSVIILTCDDVEWLNTDRVSVYRETFLHGLWRTIRNLRSDSIVTVMLYGNNSHANEGQQLLFRKLHTQGHIDYDV